MSPATATVAPLRVTPPLNPPQAWFADPQFAALTPMTVDPDGRVYGHLASWQSCHTDSKALGSQCVRAPRSRNGYSMFHTGALTTAEGTTIAVGHIVAGAPHSDPTWNLNATLVHYSHSGWTGADVRVGEDRHGIWVAGALRPDVSPEQLRALRSSPLSGDWRTDPATGALELVAALAVSSPGFLVPRPQALVASSGAVESLYAVGVVARVDRTSELRSAQLSVMSVQAEAARRALPGGSTPKRFARRNFDAVAARLAAHQDGALVASMSTPGAAVVLWEGVLGVEGLPTGDGRLIDPGALSVSDLPIPLRWVKTDVGGHDGAIVIGLIQTVQRGADGMIHGTGVVDLGSPEGREVARQLSLGYAGGVSFDLDAVDSAPVFAPVATEEDAGTPTMIVSAGRIRAATLVAVPAFAEAKIALSAPYDPNAQAAPIDDDEADCGCTGVIDTLTAPVAATPSTDPAPPAPVAVPDPGAFPGLDAFPDIDAMKTLAARARALRPA